MSELKIIAFMVKNPDWHFGLDLVAEKLSTRFLVYQELAELEHFGLIERRPEPNHSHPGELRHQFRSLIGKSPIQPLNVFLESREFYEACQQYRQSSDPVDTPATFEALKEWIRQGAVT